MLRLAEQLLLWVLLALFTLALAWGVLHAAPAPWPKREARAPEPHPPELCGHWRMGWECKPPASEEARSLCRRLRYDLRSDGTFAGGFADSDRTSWVGTWARKGAGIDFTEWLVSEGERHRYEFTIPAWGGTAVLPAGRPHAGTTAWLERPTRATD
jgi:hypothetical protein